MDHTQQFVEEAAGREVIIMIQVYYVSLGLIAWDLVKADCEIRTAGSDKLYQPQRMGGSPTHSVWEAAL